MAIDPNEEHKKETIAQMICPFSEECNQAAIKQLNLPEGTEVESLSVTVSHFNDDIEREEGEGEYIDLTERVTEVRLPLGHMLAGCRVAGKDELAYGIIDMRKPEPNSTEHWLQAYFSTSGVHSVQQLIKEHKIMLHAAKQVAEAIRDVQVEVLDGP
jgi:hypothetical protein